MAKNPRGCKKEKEKKRLTKNKASKRYASKYTQTTPTSYKNNKNDVKKEG